MAPLPLSDGDDEREPALALREGYSCCGSVMDLIGRSRRIAGRGLTDGLISSGRQPAMVRTHSRAHAMLPTPGNSRRNSTTADSSPRCSNAVRIMAACALLTQNIDGACEREPVAGKCLKSRRLMVEFPASQPEHRGHSPKAA
jgi:hypothetical protein